MSSGETEIKSGRIRIEWPRHDGDDVNLLTEDTQRHAHTHTHTHTQNNGKNTEALLEAGKEVGPEVNAEKSKSTELSPS